MKRFLRSIRWRLQFWNAGLLLLALLGFGFTAYFRDRSNRWRRIDSELLHRNSVLNAALRQRPAGRPPPPGADEPPGQGPDREFRIPRPEQGLFEDPRTGNHYYIVWRRDGRVIARSSRVPSDIVRPLPEPRRGFRMGDGVREYYEFTPPGECIVSGRDITGELADLRRFAWWLVATGGGILVAGVAGGAWIAGRAIRPVNDISAAAAEIANGDLARRIHSAETDSELGQLVGILNETFRRLEATFEQQARFTADAAHELRTPVTVLLTRTQTALARERPAGEYRDALEACQRAAQRMRGLIESLLELARLDAGQEPMRFREVNVSALLHETVEELRPLAAVRGIQLHEAVSPETVPADPDRLRQVIVNLLTNAIHYNRDGGGVWVALERGADGVSLQVRDSGIGISPADLPHVFDRFYRADASRSRADGRTGLGLAITRSIVEAHRGRISVTSEPGQGTTFTVWLPAAGVPGAGRAPAAEG